MLGTLREHGKSKAVAKREVDRWSKKQIMLRKIEGSLLKFSF